MISIDLKEKEKKITKNKEITLGKTKDIEMEI